MASIDEVTNCNLLNTPYLLFHEVYGGHEIHENIKRPSLESLFGLFVLGYHRNMVVRHGRFCGRGPARYVDIKDYSKVTKTVLEATKFHE